MMQRLKQWWKPYLFCPSGEEHNLKLISQHGNRHGENTLHICTVCGTERYWSSCASYSAVKYTRIDGKVLHDRTVMYED